MRLPRTVDDEAGLRETTLVLLRHGHTAGNDRGEHVRMSGWTDVPLSAFGEEQARQLAVRLASEPAAAALYASPLQRARATAEVIAARLRMPVLLEDGLREIFCGTADGMPVGEVRARFPREWARNERQEDPDARWPGGESYREFRARVWAAASRIARRHAGSRVLVVTHAGVISQLLGRIAGSPAGLWSEWRPDNGSISEILWDPDRVRLVRFDDRGRAAPARET